MLLMRQKMVKTKPNHINKAVEFGSYYSAEFIFPDFFLTFQDKINNFSCDLFVYAKYQCWLSIACNRTRNKGSRTNLKV